jgi:PAS domain S-box-containing protein
MTYHDKYSQRLKDEMAARTADLVERTKQAGLLAEQAALLDLSQDAIVVQDMDGRIVFWNRGAEVMYGWHSNEVLGRNANELLRAECSESDGDIEATLLRQGRWEGEAVHYKRDGTLVNVASRRALQRDGVVSATRILTVNTDITGHKAAERALEQLRQDQLRFQDDFLSHVSHELRSPLTAIKQFTSVLLRGLAGELNKEQRRCQEIVSRNIGQLQSVIDDLLEATRIEGGKLTVEPERVAVAEAVADVFNTFQVTARAKTITLSCDLPSDLPHAYADPARLRQILIILLDNAVKFTPDGGVVAIQARPYQRDPRYLVLEVSDDGIGISPENAEKLFERHYQIAEHIQTSRKGLGLGLYICKELVTRQGGQIWARRRTEKGSTFSFTLPVFSPNSRMAPLVEDGDPDGLQMMETRVPAALDSRDETAPDAPSLMQLVRASFSHRLQETKEEP